MVGFGLRDGEEVLIADDPIAFANNMARLLQDAELWERLARQGRAYMLAEHSREMGQARLGAAISAVLARTAKPAPKRSTVPAPVSVPENTAKSSSAPGESWAKRCLPAPP